MKSVERILNNQTYRKLIGTIQERFKGAEVGLSAAAIAYYLLLSLFPLTIAIGNILPFLNLVPEMVLPYISAMVPESIFTMLEGTIRSLLSVSNGGVLSVSAIATLWASSRSINALQITLNKVYGVERRANMILTRLFSFGAIFLFLLSVIVVALLFSFGQRILDYILPILNLPISIVDIFQTLKWPVTLLVLFVTMCVIYAFLPNAKVRLRSILPGAIFASVGWMILTQFFGLYTHYFSKGFTSYGLIGGFVVFMLWLDFAATVIILGGLINAVFEEFISGSIETRNSSLNVPLRKIARQGKKYTIKNKHSE